MFAVLLLCSLGLSGIPEPPVAAWEFNSPEEARLWRPNSHMEHVSVENGILSCDTIDWDPFFTCSEAELATSPTQFVVLRIRASKAGEGQLYWTSQKEGPYSGFDPSKVTNFTVEKPNLWQEIVLLPFWHTEGTLRQLRLDLYEGAHFEVDWLRVYDRAEGATAASDSYRWEFDDGGDSWRLRPESRTLVSPPLHLDITEKGWVSLAVKARAATTASLFWAHSTGPGSHGLSFEVPASDTFQVCDIELQGESTWRDVIVALGIEAAVESGFAVESIEITDTPLGPADIRVLHFGFENGVNRAERDSLVVARFVNDGGATSPPTSARLVLPEGLSLVEGDAVQPLPALAFRERAMMTWTLRAAAPGTARLLLDFPDAAPLADPTAALEFLAPMPVQPADYVPEPRPVETSLDVFAYYFPGWDVDVKWNPIRFVDPVRKPLLGYYDEGLPEVVDWQIKWAVENGIKGFLVDWYWSAGHQYLTHWFEAYRQARYRDQLQVAIMWANHNAPDTHSAEDWRQVTREWLDRYFNLPGYYRIDGKPAVFIWAPDNIRRDLGGTEAVAQSFAESQQMARDAGYAGITYVAMGYNVSRERSDLLAKEGYYGFSTYHEWGDAVKQSPVPHRAQFSDVADTSAAAWDAYEAIAGPLTYYPVADTGWDSRPWHGPRSLAILGRTPALFEHVLRDLKTWAETHRRGLVILAPVNEWGEGSYIEPNTEFGFDMYEAVRRVFAVSDSASWPVNMGPIDVARGPYEFPPRIARSSWDFSDGVQEWSALMGVSELVAQDGVLRFTTSSNDPAILNGALDLQASQYARLIIVMQTTGKPGERMTGQLFWSETGAAITESTSIRFPLFRDGAKHTYTLNLSAHPRWRGEITSLRFDPCDKAGVAVAIDEIRLEK